MGQLKNIEALQTIFEKNQKMFWRAYTGLSMSAKSKIGEYDDESGDLESSWSDLEELLGLYGDGTFKIALMSKKGTNNNGANIHTVKIGEGSSRSLSNSGGGNISTQLENLIKLNQFLDNKSGDEVSGVYEGAKEEFQKDLEIYKMKMELKDLKKESALEKILGTCIEKLPFILNQFTGQPVSTALGSTGSSPKTKMGYDGRTTEEGPDPDQEVHEIDLNQLVNDANRMQDLFPEKNVNLLFHKLVNFCEKDPAQAKMLLSQL